jgi:hypothetical protein
MDDNLSIDPKQVSVFPNTNKTIVDVEYIVESHRCLIVNSAITTISVAESQKFAAEVFDDCIVCADS